MNATGFSTGSGSTTVSATRWVLIGASALILLVGACAPGAEPGETTTTSTQQPMTTAAPTTTTTAATTTTTAEGAAPSELDGSWRAEDDDGETVRLSLRGTNYTIVRGPAEGTGKITVEGQTIAFHSGSLCDGIDTYTWTVDGETLTLLPPPAVECSGRAISLDQPFTLVMP